MKIRPPWMWLPGPVAYRLAFPGDAKRERAERKSARRDARAARQDARKAARAARKAARRDARQADWAARKTVRPEPAPAELAGTLRAFRAAALWGVAVLIVTAAGAAFAESYRGLFEWAEHHGLAGFWAAAFPLQVDVFMGVGELVLLIAMIDHWRRCDQTGAWAVALLGLGASIAGNVGHVAAHDLQSRGTAAVPPLAAFAALWLGLGVLKRVIARRAESAPGAVTVPVLPEVPTDAEAAAYIALRASTWAGNPLSGRQLETRFGISRAQATRVRDLVAAGMNGHHAAEDAINADQ